IYAYLLQKLEESELKLSRDIRAGKTVDVAYSDIKPSKPNKILVVVLAFIGAIAFAYCAAMALGFIRTLLARRKAGKDKAAA
ncbi:MAG: hypothetical protein J6J61_01570, partial [Muribaculaceae bacterium]|nr:hypothetical protein [Muribaculaceae bacterium]